MTQSEHGYGAFIYPAFPASATFHPVPIGGARPHLLLELQPDRDDGT
jgi:hypothetical protein